MIPAPSLPGIRSCLALRGIVGIVVDDEKIAEVQRDGMDSNECLPRVQASGWAIQDWRE